ncbi:MAG: 6-phosphogluconolactonase [Candidatus ainarchaeum sp.]|nr:6-phosphogluconolactonase [Candidatus ainarchaeum sp.]
MEKLNKLAAKILARSIKQILKKKEYLILGLAGGRSLFGFLKVLSRETEIPWKKIHFFLADERIVPVSSKESNFRMIKGALFDRLASKKLLPKKNIHKFAMNKKPCFGLFDYEKELKKYGNFYDILVLSSGEDGHIASLFPKHDSIKNNSECYLIVKNSPKPPEKRMSVSRKMILRSKIVLLFFIGEAKKTAYKKFLEKGNGFFVCPAKLTKRIKELYVLTSHK